ncbi:MAG TPA: MOP flippase family protein [Saprospiraceae bacterium]|nr:MOP flippase family protein [Saprospiraceae bacterium]
MSIVKKAWSGIRWTSLSSAFAFIIALIKISFLTRLLHPSDFGLMALATFLLGFSSMFINMGIGAAILHKNEISREEYSSLFWLHVIFSMILVTILSGAAPWIAIFYREEELTRLIPIISVHLVFSALGYQFKIVAQKRLEFRYISLVEISGAFLGAILSIILAFKGWGVYALVWGAIIQAVLVNSCYFFSGTLRNGLLLHFRFHETKPFLRIGLYQTGGQIANFFNKDLDILLVGKWFGSEVLGGYSLAKQLCAKPILIINPILTFVASPLFSQIQNEAHRLKQAFLRLVNWTGALNFPVYLILLLFARPVVGWLYGESYLHIVIWVQILSVYMFLRSLANPLGSLTIATGKTYLEWWWNFGLLFVFPVILWFGSFWGIHGIVISLTFFMFVLLYLHWRWLILRMLPADLYDLIRASFYYPYPRLLKELKNLYSIKIE